MKNADVAERLNEIADLLDVLGERFKPEAYRRAARSVESMVEGVDRVAERDALREVPGIGEAIDEKIRELLRTGTIAYLEKLRLDVPPGLREMMRLPGIGPKTARRFWTEFQLEGPAELADAIRGGRLNGARGFGEKKLAQLSAVLARDAAPNAGRRIPIEEAFPLARSLRTALASAGVADRVELAGSFRRARESIGDLDLLVTSKEPPRVFDLFSRLPEVAEVRLRGPTKETVVLHGGLQVDLRVVEPESFGAALQYFTGSKDHNVRLRSLARERGLKINEYGVFRGEERIGGRTEEEVYGLLDLAWIPPELREDRGEIATAAKGKFPPLISRSDLRGELHLHVREDDGADGWDSLVRSARGNGWEYVGVVVGRWERDGSIWSLPPDALAALRQRSSSTLRLLTLLEGPDRTPPPALASLPHDGFVLTSTAGNPPERTHPGSDRTPTLAVAHLGGTEGAEATTAIALARASGAAIEVGPGTARADSALARAAREAGVRLIVPTGLGEPDGSPTCDVALGFARRAAATPEDVLNTRTWDDVVTASVRRGKPR